MYLNILFYYYVILPLILTIVMYYCILQAMYGPSLLNYCLLSIVYCLLVFWYQKIGAVLIFLSMKATGTTHQNCCQLGRPYFWLSLLDLIFFFVEIQLQLE